jgi:hypothetical protein
MNCGTTLPMQRYVGGTCEACETRYNEGYSAHATENPNSSESDRMYAGRMAMGSRSLRPSNNYINPREFSAAKHSIGTHLTPPQSGDRGTPHSE